MAPFRAWTAAALVGALAASARAGPAVRVGVRAAFAAPPYLVELLETAAAENATAYFPLLDRIAAGDFDSAATDQQLYARFRRLLEHDGHLGAEDLASFDYALALHAAAPRVEAHYQYYATSVVPALAPADTLDACDSWVHEPARGRRSCAASGADDDDGADAAAHRPVHRLPFDRVLGDARSPAPAVLYADIQSPSFRALHIAWSRAARGGRASYRLRYKPASAAPRGPEAPLTVSGYGIELALKRTDYIVIDDRHADAEGRDGEPKSTAGHGAWSEAEEEDDDDVSDLRPLSHSELRQLGLRAASVVMASDRPLDTLLRLSQDFPKHSAAVAAADVSPPLLAEHRANRAVLGPAGLNAVWINGVQVAPRDVEAYALLQHLRRERSLIRGARELGLSGAEAVALLSHEAVSAARREQEDTPRYDWRDEAEGGGVIIWMNDIERDARYADWPAAVDTLLQRGFPGQLPAVRKDAHNLVIPVDFADRDDALLVAETLRGFVRRQVPIRFGLVPLVTRPESEAQATAFRYLVDRYGRAAALDYLETAVASAGRKFGPVSAKLFAAACRAGTLRPGRHALSLPDLAADADLAAATRGAAAWVARIGGTDPAPPVLVNGAPVPRGDDWLQAMSARVGHDLRILQHAVYQGELTDDDYLPDLFLEHAARRRRPLLVPEDDGAVRHVDLAALPHLARLPSLPAREDTIERERVHLTVVADLDGAEGFAQLMDALLCRREHDNLELAWLHLARHASPEKRLASAVTHDAAVEPAFHDLLRRYDARVAEHPAAAGDGAALDAESRKRIYAAVFDEAAVATSPELDDQVRARWAPFGDIVSAVGLAPGQKALLVNGRIVGPLPDGVDVEGSDLEELLSYERKQRLLPAARAVEALGLQEKASTPQAFARVSNLIARSMLSDVPEGIFEAGPAVRTAAFKRWNSTHTAIHLGDEETATVQLYASIDPASELAQKWIPIIKTLTEMDGVSARLFLNPKDRLEEIPVKRFYRHVVSAKPTFAPDGSLRAPAAHFRGLPADALLTVGMDLPPAWLVAPKTTVHDLDNIKLSAVKADIDATYELEHILIEGHSRDVTLGAPPRGAQLVLGTDADPHVADTIVMANLGYFQFKANPGMYRLALQHGRSADVFHLDGAGAHGHPERAGDDDTTEIGLMSFQGTTLFPRLSRKPGMEDEDPLEPAKTARDVVVEGAESLLSHIGLANRASKYLSKVTTPTTTKARRVPERDRHADINIFSVASGHLYERMLNIMMVSVMKHTAHSVKFWFIEQFLSPSFKDFLPVMAERYGFRYEMVTYKWPHWLRAQKEKQREIWGYKILFLDVLFPLDLDKVIFVDADQIVRADMYELVTHDLHGAPYAFTPMCDSRTDMEGFRFWKQGYWKNFLRGLPYHISALYVVDLKRFRQMAAGDRLRQNYHQLSADPDSLSNLDQDLPNHMQSVLPIHSLPQDWLWCETWCSDDSLPRAKTIDLCNNPQTKEPKLDRARRQVPEWSAYDDEIAALAQRHKHQQPPHGAPPPPAHGGESMQERLQREDAETEERTRKGEEEHVRDEL